MMQCIVFSIIFSVSFRYFTHISYHLHLPQTAH